MIDYNVHFFQKMSQERRLSIHGAVIRSRSIGRAASWGASSSDDESNQNSILFYFYQRHNFCNFLYTMLL